MKEAADRYGLKTIIGVELSTFHHFADGKFYGVHLCGFDFDPDHPALRDFIPFCASIQTDRSKLLFEWGKENGTLRDGIDWTDICNDHPHHDYICNNEIFASYMKRGIYRYDEYEDFFKAGFCHISEREARIEAITGKSYRQVLTEEAVRRVREAGGVAVVAHPRGYSRYAEELLGIGVMGFETRHSMINETDREFFENFCRAHNLYELGGSDHENVLGGLLSFSDEYSSSYDQSGVDEEAFDCLLNRRLG